MLSERICSVDLLGEKIICLFDLRAFCYFTFLKFCLKKLSTENINWVTILILYTPNILSIAIASLVKCIPFESCEKSNFFSFDACQKIETIIQAIKFRVSCCKSVCGMPFVVRRCLSVAYFLIFLGYYLYICIYKCI